MRAYTHVRPPARACTRTRITFAAAGSARINIQGGSLTVIFCRVFICRGIRRGIFNILLPGAACALSLPLSILFPLSLFPSLFSRSLHPFLSLSLPSFSVCRFAPLLSAPPSGWLPVCLNILLKYISQYTTRRDRAVAGAPRRLARMCSGRRCLNSH